MLILVFMRSCRRVLDRGGLFLTLILVLCLMILRMAFLSFRDLMERTRDNARHVKPADPLIQNKKNSTTVVGWVFWDDLV